MRLRSKSDAGRPWLAGIIAALAVGCGPLGGCGTAGSAQAEPERPEAGHPALVEGEVPADSSAEAAEAATPPPPPVIELSAEAQQARLAAQKSVLGKEEHFGEYARDLPELPPLPAAADPQLANLDALPGSEGGGKASASGDEVPPPAIDGNALGLFVPLQNAESGALDHFYDALRTLKRGEDPDGKVRVLLYGASHTAADIYPTYLRSYLSERFGDAGPGFVAAAKTNRYYRLLAMTVESSKRWVVEHAQKRKGREDGLFGLLGASTSSTSKRDVSTITPQVKGPDTPHKTTYDLFFLKQPGGGKFTVKIDGKAQKPVSTRAKEAGPGYATYTVEGGPHEVEIRPEGKGEVRLFGMTVEYDRPGIVVDTLGINGTRAANNLKWDEAIWADNVRRRAPDLYVLAYGTNESMDEDQSIEAYKRDLRAVLDRFKRAVPEASCLLVGPGDFPVKAADGAYTPRPRTAALVAAQAEVAREKGCAFWDALAFMGGEGSMVLWAMAEPAMGRPDHIHLTRRGYVRMGMALTDALMQGFEAGDRAPARPAEEAPEAEAPEAEAPVASAP
ncbi:MAG: hypothetical protein H6711_34835 [Myxococcales bacterium]|nr:hypothetical protein [Myxococcales bacterium]